MNSKSAQYGNFNGYFSADLKPLIRFVYVTRQYRGLTNILIGLNVVHDVRNMP